MAAMKEATKKWTNNENGGEKELGEKKLQDVNQSMSVAWKCTPSEPIKNQTNKNGRKN